LTGSVLYNMEEGELSNFSREIVFE
jgi:hypothetical protein